MTTSARRGTADARPRSEGAAATRIRPTSIAARLFVVQLLCIVVAASAAVVFLATDARGRATDEAADRSLVVASAVAHNPFVVESVQLADPSTVLQPYAAELMDETHVDFITIMNPDRTRYTHRDPSQIGGRFLGSIEPALEGRSFTETYTGTLGPSVRAVTPVTASDGRVVALVSAGVTLASVDRSFASRVQLVIGAAAVLVGIGGLVSLLLARYLRRVTGGRGPEQLGQVFAYYESVLHSVREGLLLVDPAGRLVLYNDHAAELLGLADVTTPIHVRDLDLPPLLRDVLAGAEEISDELVLTHDRVLVVSQRPATSPHSRGDRGFGTVTTLRDRTELQRVTGELESMRTMSDALRSQTHEFANRLHTIASLLELGRQEEALSFAADELGLSQRLADRVLGSIQEPIIAALMLGKAAQARERGVALHLETHLEPGTQGLDPATLVSIIGNLIDNAIDAAYLGSQQGGAAGGDPWVELYLGRSEGDDGDLVIQVSDNGPGLADDEIEQVFTRGFSTKHAGADGRGIGLALVRQLVNRHGGTIEVSRHVGAVFTVQLPLAGGESHPAAPARTDAR